MNKVVVKGGSEFIFSNLAEELARREKVVIIDNLSTGRIETNQNLNEKDNVKESIINLKLLNGTFKGFDYIFHQLDIPNVSYLIENSSATNETKTKTFYYIAI